MNSKWFSIVRYFIAVMTLAYGFVFVAVLFGELIDPLLYASSAFENTLIGLISLALAWQVLRSPINKYIDTPDFLKREDHNS